MNGFIFYNGPSVLDGAQIIGIATLKSKNEKTGPMVQTWILRSDMSPLDASKQKLDSSICGNCPHRHSVGGACYVQIFQAPQNIYKSYKKGNYLDFSNCLELAAHTLNKKAVRLGAYGDPAAIPFEVWQNLLTKTRKTTGYTHQLRHRNFDQRITNFCMISADTEKHAKLINDKLGLRTFRVKSENAPLLENEILCKSESDGLTCVECGLCDSAQGFGVNIAINVHGLLKKRYEKINAVNL